MAFRLFGINKLIKKVKILFRQVPKNLLLRAVYRKIYFTVKGSIYPISIPDIKINSDLDFLLLELPPRYMPMMPNGVGYVYNILKRCGIKFQVIDANIVFYHRYHSKRILDKIDPIVTPNSYILKKDPWDNAGTDEWANPEVAGYFLSQFKDIIQDIIANRPKAVGLSVHASNRVLAKEFVRMLRSEMPDVTIVVGGYDCVYREIGPFLFPDFDYMVVGEAELTLSPLVKALAKGKKPKDLPGIISRYDSQDRKWVETPLLYNLDEIDFPRYEWTDIMLYYNYKGGHLVPITGSRGCRWGRCRFCAECFPFRKRSPQKVADEIEFMVSKGFYVFHFNESDVNGDPQNLHDICSEIISRGLRVQFMGQLRIDRRNTREYFEHLKKAGFTHLRFGVDGWAENVLRLQRKGYNMHLVSQNLRDCYDAGIYTTVNVVIGVPGETDDDVNETIKNLVVCKDYVNGVESLNTLILAGGSDYYKNPDTYKIRFRSDKNLIYKDHHYYIPTDLWYSEDPYIDQEVRMCRLDRICTELYKHGVNIGAFSTRAIEKLREEIKAKSAEMR